MSQKAVAAVTTAAIADGSQVEFSLAGSLFTGGRKPVLSVKGLATDETLSFWYKAGDEWNEVTDSSGTQIAFTATYGVDVFNAPGTYGFTKDETAAAVTLFVEDGR